MTYLAECERCHLLIRVAYDTGTTLCNHCLARRIEQEAVDERLWRQRERHCGVTR